MRHLFSATDLLVLVFVSSVYFVVITFGLAANRARKKTAFACDGIANAGYGKLRKTIRSEGTENVAVVSLSQVLPGSAVDVFAN